MDGVQKLDKKFYGSIYKVKDNTRVPEDQYVVFLAKDTAFAEALPAYRAACERLGADATQLLMTDNMIARVLGWREAHPELCKVPDAAGEKVLA